MAKKKIVTIAPKKKGQKPVKFRKGGLHQSTGTPMGQNIPMEKISKALAGGFGPLAQKQANMAQGMLKKGRRTAAKRRKRTSSEKTGLKK